MIQILRFFLSVFYGPEGISPVNGPYDPSVVVGEGIQESWIPQTGGGVQLHCVLLGLSLTAEGCQCLE